MDLTPLFNDALSRHGAPVIPIGRKPSPPVEAFLKEAYRIEAHISSLNRYLLSVRQSYLSTARAPPTRLLRSSSSLSDDPDRRYLTDKQRDEIDAEAKSVIKQSISVIQTLESVERVRIEAEKVNFKKKRRRGLGRFRSILLEDENDIQPEEDEESRTIRLHHEGVIWLLRNRLERASELQREQQEIRVMRQVERSKSMLYKATGPIMNHGETSSSRPASSAGRKDGITDGWARGLPPEEKEDIEKMLSPEQLQIFAKENQDMMKYYEDTLDQVRSAERSLIEISELQTQLAGNLASQSVYIDQLVADSITTTDNIQKGNKQLKEASERSSFASSFFYGAVAFSLFAITYDFLL